MKKALSRLQLMARRTSWWLRSRGTSITCETAGSPFAPWWYPSRPVPGHTSANEWRGIHPLSNLVQVTNPPGGWMQNCKLRPRRHDDRQPDDPREVPVRTRTCTTAACRPISAPR